jgi:hypothetical protein
VACLVAAVASLLRGGKFEHYRTPRISFLETADAFLELFGEDVVRLEGTSFDTADLPDGGPVAVVPSAP